MTLLEEMQANFYNMLSPDATYSHDHHRIATFSMQMCMMFVLHLIHFLFLFFQTPDAAQRTASDCLLALQNGKHVWLTLLQRLRAHSASHSGPFVSFFWCFVFVGCNCLLLFYFIFLLNVCNTEYLPMPKTRP